MAASYAKAKGRREKGSFVPLPRAVLQDEKFARLSPRATKLLVDLLAQYGGFNNGDLEATFNTMQERGWRSKSQLAKGIKELREAGFIRLTRQGGLGGCSLYAVTFFSIDECGGKLEEPATKTPPGDWRK